MVRAPRRELPHDVESAAEQRRRSLVGAKARMGAQRNAVVPGERMVGPQRFESEDIEARAGDVAPVQRFEQRGLVDQRSARGVDDDGAAFQQRPQ